MARDQGLNAFGRRLLNTVIGTLGERLLAREFDGGGPRGGDAQRFAQLFAVAGHDCNFTPSSRSCNVEQLLFHSIGGEDHAVHGLALAAMRSNCITVVELAIIHRQRTAIFELNAPAVHVADLHQFAIRGAEVRIPAIACKQEPVPGNFAYRAQPFQLFKSLFG